METVDQICLNTAEPEARGYRALLTNHKVLFYICFMTDVLSIMNTLSLVLQKEGALFVDIHCSVDLTLDKFCELAEADSPEKYTDIMAPTKSHYAAYQEYIDILTDLGETQKFLRFQGSQINIQNFHYSVATPIIELLMKEIKEAFDVKEYPFLDAFHSFHPRNIPKLNDLPSDHGVENAKKIYSFYGQNRIYIYEGRRNEGSKLIKASQECFLQQCIDYFMFISYRKEKANINYGIKLEVAEQKLLQLQTKQKCTAKLLKEAKEEVCTLQKQCNNSVTLYEALQACHEIFPDFTIVLESIQVCPSSTAFVERLFSLMDLIMNDLRISMNIQAIDALIRLHYIDDSFSDIQVQDIKSIWLKRGNRKIELA